MGEKERKRKWKERGLEDDGGGEVRSLWPVVTENRDGVDQGNGGKEGRREKRGEAGEWWWEGV